MKRYLKKGEILENVVFITQNIIVCELQAGIEGGQIVLLGNGDSLSIDENHQIIKVDEFSTKLPSVEIFDVSTKVIAFYYSFEAKGLAESSKDLASYILKEWNSYSLIAIGHSKAGWCIHNAFKQYKPSKKSMIVTISVPYAGTVLANHEHFKRFQKKFNFILNLIHKIAFKEHNVEKDLSPNSVILNELLRDPQIEVPHINMISVLQDRENCHSFKDYICYFVDRSLSLYGDGITSENSQKIRYCNLQIKINAPHESSLEIGLKELKMRGIIY